MQKTNNLKAHSRNLRQGRVSTPGQVYSLTIVTQNRQQIFTNFPHARKVIQILHTIEKQKWATTLCFVLMPDHLHWLMQLGEAKELSSLVQQFKSWASKAIGKPIWQKGFYDHALRQEEDIKNIARYIVTNPLRANIVTKLNDYPHWDAIWLT